MYERFKKWWNGARRRYGYLEFETMLWFAFRAGWLMGVRAHNSKCAALEQKKDTK